MDLQQIKGKDNAKQAHKGDSQQLISEAEGGGGRFAFQSNKSLHE